MARLRSWLDVDGYACFQHGVKLSLEEEVKDCPILLADDNFKRVALAIHGAIVAGLALAQRRKVASDSGDIKALADIENRLLKEIARLEKMDSEAEKIGRSASKIREEVRKTADELRRVVDNGKATLRALEIELDEEQAEIDSPIVVRAYEGAGPENEGNSASAA
jgi:hypothetical protein